MKTITMNPEELKNIWSQQTPSTAAAARLTPELIWHLADETTSFRRAIFWRDIREWFATIFIAGVFLYAAFAIYDRIHWLMIAAAIVACLPMTYVAFRRQKHSSPAAGATLTGYLRDSIANVQCQFELLRSLARWYLAPLAASGAIVLVDVFSTAPAPFRVRIFLIIPSVFIIAGVFWGVWKLNQRTVRKDLEPRLRQLEQTLAEIESEPVGGG